MLLKKTGFPQEGELLICTVTKIMPSSVFVTLDEYNTRSAMIHIAEVAPGRIRNIREYVIEGKKIVCKVLNVNKEKGYIDLSLRRVTESMRRAKADEIKQEQKAEKIIEYAARELQKKPEEIFQEIQQKIGDSYESLYGAFEDIAQEKLDIEKKGVEKKIAEKITKIVKEKILPPSVFVEGNMTITTYAADGVDVIKQAFEKATGEGVEAVYVGGGTYKIKVTTEEYKMAEKKLKTIIDHATAVVEKSNGTATFKRIEAK